MPLARIETRRAWPPEQVRAMMDAVYQSFREALKVPEGDRNVRYVEHRPEHWVTPPNKSDNVTLVEVTMFPGRSLAAKKALYAAIVQRFEALGIAPSDVMIVLNEPLLDNWAVRGGTPASELDLGFSLKV
ncbi:MAG TPA: tautomerase family protein [Ideonella sp.]|uniref:tautomerase family protein n=1 Tax=Ideonella sp. TaxID=1929293 RepID=UPI002E2FA01F|nr:tautomerase family protein [Ideonella sp.]HEX5687042.1 tautomerase family protein [Ideonella sp.]